MTFDIVFVHGTGVREPACSKASNKIVNHLKERDKSLSFHKCYWGGSLGTKLNVGGQSIPVVNTKKTLDTNLSDEEYFLGLWELLYQDPLIELQILAIRAGETEAVFGAPPDNELNNRVRAFTSSPELQEMLDRSNLGEFFDQAQTIIVNETDFQNAVESAEEPLGEYRTAIARASVAQSYLLAKEKYGDLSISLDGELRDRIVDKIVEELGGSDKGLISEVQKSISGTIRRIITNNARSRRRGFSEKYSGTLGDILMYQARGQKIRDYVRDTIEPLTKPIVLIGHSLGGIICVDLLLEEKPPNVALLVTVGSQSPVLYELNALVGMEYDSNAKLPINFPEWLNIYDRNDFLSYVGEEIFPGKINDVEVKSRQPFPQAHGAYWENDKVYDAIWQKMEEVANG